MAAELQWIAEGGSRVGLPAVVIVAGGASVSARPGRRPRSSASLAALGFGDRLGAPGPEAARARALHVREPGGRHRGGPAGGVPGRAHGRLRRGRRRAADGRSGCGRSTPLEARPLTGTEGALRPIWSPDSKLHRVRRGRQAAQGRHRRRPRRRRSATRPTGADGTWSPDGVILFDGRATDPIWRVDAAGGVRHARGGGRPRQGGDRGGLARVPARRPPLPLRHATGELGGRRDADGRRASGANDGRELLKTASQGRLRAARLPRSTSASRRSWPSPSTRRSLQITGEPVPVGEGLGVNNVGRRVLHDLRHGRSRLPGGQVGGAAAALGGPRPARRRPPWRSPEDYGDTVALARRQAPRLRPDQGLGKGSDIWIRDVARGVTSRFTFDAANEIDPVWSPDGRQHRLLGAAQDDWDLYAQGRGGHGRGGGPAREGREQVRERVVEATGSTCSSAARARTRASTCGRCR